MCGLDDAILCARAFVQDEPFAVLLGDDVVYNGGGRPALKQLIDVYNETGSSVLGCQTVPEEKVSRRPAAGLRLRLRRHALRPRRQVRLPQII